MKNLTKVATYLPVFTGFYDTIFSSDSELENLLYEGEVTEDIWDEFDYSNFQKDIIEQCCGVIENECPFLEKVELEEVVSPREYNFRNDSANVEMLVDIKKIKEWIKTHKEVFKEYLKDTYTSYDGFSSSYPNDYEGWKEETKNFTELDGHYLGSILECYFRYEEFDDYTLFELIEYHTAVWENLKRIKK